MINVKQYGAQRTGTNYLKRLIELNFENVTVFGSVLGWKHGMYETGNGYQHTCSSHREWIKNKTKNGKVYSVDNHVLSYTPEQLEQACDNLHYLISVKDPYAYIVSYKRFRANKQPWNEQHVIKWIQQYLDCYAVWRTLYDKQPEACYIVDYKQLIHNRDVVLSSIQSKFRLERKHSDFVDENKTVNASTDHGLIIDRNTQFNIDYYTEQRYMQEIPDNIKDLLFEKLETCPVISRC